MAADTQHGLAVAAHSRTKAEPGVCGSRGGSAGSTTCVRGAQCAPAIDDRWPCSRPAACRAAMVVGRTGLRARACALRPAWLAAQWPRAARPARPGARAGIRRVEDISHVQNQRAYGMGTYQAGTALTSRSERHLAFARLFSSAVVSQALLSAASFVVGLVFLRNASAAQYGYYVLALNAVMLLGSLQNAFFGPPLAIRMSHLDAAGRGLLTGGLYCEQRRISVGLGLAAILVV